MIDPVGITFRKVSEGGIVGSKIWFFLNTSLLFLLFATDVFGVDFTGRYRIDSCEEKGFGSGMHGDFGFPEIENPDQRPLVIVHVSLYKGHIITINQIENRELRISFSRYLSLGVDSEPKVH
ncbi:MAG: hypothetical protein HQK54_13470, partial [Oligoflexales bacterium]|nr:hypothetical protein [Oligoflexales bacterium]